MDSETVIIAALAALMQVCEDQGLNFGLIYHEAEALFLEKEQKA